MIEIFRAGKHTPYRGEALNFTEDDVQQIARDYDPELRRAPFVKGHPELDKPAYGYPKALTVKGQKLLAIPEKVDPVFAEEVNAGKWIANSIALYKPGHPQNPIGDKGYYLKHVGFLGSAQPSVSGLEAPSFAEPEEGVLVFGDWGDMANASILRGLRDWIIGKFGLDEADKAIPSWAVSAVEADAVQDSSESEGSGMMYAEREQALSVREQELAQKEEQLKKQALRLEFAEFAEGLIQKGKLLPVRKAAVVELLLQVEPLGSITFGEGDDAATQSPGELLRELLSNQPTAVEFGEVASEEEIPGTAEFAAPSGFGVDAAQLAYLAKAQAYRQEHPDLDIVDCYIAVGGK